MGVALQDVTPEIASFLGMKEASGALIQAVEPKGPADSAKLKKGDVILDMDKKPVKDSGDVILGISDKSPGDRVTLLVWREGKTFSQPVVLARRMDPSVPAAPAPAEQATHSLQLTSLNISPETVKSGSVFNVVVNYEVSDPSVKEQEIPVAFSFSILEGSNVLYSPASKEIKSANGGPMKRTEPITAAKRKGTFTLKVSLQYKGRVAEKSGTFRID